MTDKFIQLEKDDIFRIGIKDCEGKDTGDILEFDLSDIELPLRYQEMIEKDKKNRIEMQNKLQIISKKEDVKSSKMFTKNQEEVLHLVKDFFDKEKEVYNMFLGENGVEKLLQGRKLGWTTLNEIDNIIDKFILPNLDINFEKVTDKIKKVYGYNESDDDSVLR